jgi:hypothetical protein
MAGHPMLPEYEPIAHNGNRVRNAIHRAETLALWAEELYGAGNGGDGKVLASIANAWAQIAVATAQSFGGGAS